MKDGDGEPALHLAAVAGHETITRILLRSGVKIESEDFTGRTALHCAAAEGHGAVVKQLLCGGANIEAKDDYGKTPLHCAVENEQVMVVLQLLLENTSNIQIKRARMAAARTLQSRYEAVAWLLKYGLDIGSVEGNADTMLHWAAVRGLTTVVRLLLEKDLTLRLRTSLERQHCIWQPVMGMKQ
jgi:ankyrin repeat protein